MTNQKFCYWLQGYFEIGINVTITSKVVQQIRTQLDLIDEPLGQFTSWLQKVCDYIETKKYSDAICDHFTPIIKQSLNSIFFHVIDNTYTTDKTKDELLRIHNGEHFDK